MEPPKDILQKKDAGIIGEVVLGKIDPRSFSEREFNASPDLLYHGAAQEFAYSPHGEFNPLETGGDGSNDYGDGFYTTDNKDQAKSYSHARSPVPLERPITYSFLPHNARMLDVRDSRDPGVNGSLPPEFVNAWIQYLGDYVGDNENYSKMNKFLEGAIRGGQQEFLDNTRNALQGGKDIGIRGNYKDAGIFGYDKNALIAYQFKKFMLSQGYDGMIYREGGEGEKAENLTGYVFYNPKVVDTHEGWLKREE